MVQVQCFPPGTKHYLFLYCPSFPAAVAFAFLFGLTLLVHVFQAFHYRKWFCWPIIMGATWETLGFIFRIGSVLNTTKVAYFVPSQLLILLAPLWINGFLYVVMARLIYFFLPEKRVYGIRAERLSVIFVMLDITAFIVQASGGLMINPSNSIKTQQNGLHVYMGGIGLQQLFVLFFTSLVIRFQLRMRQVDPRNGGRWRRPLYTMYACIVLITIRIMFRLIEYSGGVNSTLQRSETAFYLTEPLPMFSALLSWNISHPGTVLVGPDSEFPTRKERRELEKMGMRPMRA